MEVGSWLVLVAVFSLMALARANASASLEHPKQKGQKVASIWRLDEVASLESEATKYGFQRVDLDMLMFGKESQKPTTALMNTDWRCIVVPSVRTSNDILHGEVQID